MFLKPQKIVCNNAKIRAILERTASKFPHISLPILAFVGNSPIMCDMYITRNIERKHIPAYLANSTEERRMGALVWVGNFPPIPRYVMLINEREWFKTFQTKEEMTGAIAHELAHLELWSNADIDIMISRKLRERVEASKSSGLHFHASDPYNTQQLGSNEYVADALAIGRGFGRELSACLKALRRKGRESDRCGIPYQDIDEFLLARDLVPYRIAKKNEVLRNPC
jgi:hypothetical protein